MELLSTHTPHGLKADENDSEIVYPTIPQTPELAYLMTTWMWILWPPIILVSGTFGNVATVLVLSRMSSGGGRGGRGRGRTGVGSTMNMYLLSLAVSDLFVLYAGLLRYWLLEVWQVDVYAGHSAVCKLGMWLYGAAWNNSTYLLVALTLQRAASVLWPHRVHLLCTRSTTQAVIGGIAVTSLLLLAHVPYGYEVVVSGNGTGASGVCGHGSATYHEFNAEVMVYVEIVTFALFPFLCLAVSNGVLAWTLGQSVREAKLAMAGGQRSEQVAARERKTSSTTTTVMVVSFVFIVLNLPLFILLIVSSSHHLDAPEETAEGTGEGSAEGLVQEQSGTDYFVQAFVAILLFCNSAVNFYLYCLTGTRFRNELSQWLCGCRPCCYHLVRDFRPDGVNNAVVVGDGGGDRGGDGGDGGDGGGASLTTQNTDDEF